MHHLLPNRAITKCLSPLQRVHVLRRIVLLVYRCGAVYVDGSVVLPHTHVMHVFGQSFGSTMGRLTLHE